MNGNEIPDYLAAPFGPCDVPDDYYPEAYGARPPEADLFTEPDEIGLVESLLELPTSGLYGYYTEARKYGISETVAALIEVGNTWNARANNPDIGIGDISKKGGGGISGHRSHQKGVDVDIRPLRNDGSIGPLTYQDPKYSYELTQELSDLIHGNGVLAVKFMLFNDPNIDGVAPYPNHSNHLHVRFYYPGQAAARPTLRRGSRHGTVREVQRRLNFWLLGATGSGLVPLVVDGDFGSATVSMAEAFQQSSNIEVDGIVGRATWRRLPKAAP